MFSKISAWGGMWQENHETMLVAVADSLLLTTPHPTPSKIILKEKTDFVGLYCIAY